MSKDAKHGRSGRYTYQFQISAELNERLQALRAYFPDLPSPAPMLRQQLGAFVTNYEELRRVKEAGGTEEEAREALLRAVGYQFMQMITTNSTEGGEPGK